MAKKKKRSLNSLIRAADHEQLICWQPSKQLLARKDEITRAFHSQEEDVTLSEMQGKYSQKKETSAAGSLSLIRSRHAIIAKQKDSLEQIREELGLAGKREELIKTIAENISFEKGLEKVLVYLNGPGKHYLKEKGLDMARTIEDVGRVMPEISSSEIAWLSTIQKMPRVYFCEEYGVPTILDFNIDGIEFGFDGLNSFDMQRENSRDAFSAAGITGVTEQAAFCKFNSAFNKAFKSLMLLSISDQLIYQKIFDEYRHNALIRGDGKLKRAIAEQDRAVEGRIADAMTSEEIGALEAKVKTTLSNKKIYDLARDELYSEEDIVILSGLLERVPQTILGEEAFSGYILPYGKGIKILSQEGVEIEYVPYEHYLQLVAQENIYFSTNDISRNNEMVSWVFEHYAEDIEVKLNTHRELPMDDLRQQFRERYGIIIPQRSVKSLRLEDNPMQIAFAKTAVTGKMFNYTLKIGKFELEALLKTLDKIPRSLVPEIRQIKREFMSDDAEQLVLGGMATLGTYDRFSKTITLYSPEDEPFSKFNIMEMQIHYDTYAHELGHGVWTEMTEKQRKNWMVISKAADAKTDPKNFIYDINVMRQIYTGEDARSGEKVSMLSDIGLMEEDFAEHFAAYLNHSREFRSRPELQKKYDYFKELFAEHGGGEYDDIPLVTLEARDKHKSGIIEKKSLEEAVTLQNKKDHDRERVSREHREEIVPSLEVIRGEVEDQEIVDYIYEREDPEHTYILREIKSFVPYDRDIRAAHPGIVIDLLEESPEKAAIYLQRVYKIDDEEALEFTIELRERLRTFRAENENEARTFEELKKKPKKDE
ncbi:hypothetical protein KY329_00995 [Candidatus Woesearchaeota archaeon]|nr:hypothetical protein [Candidatus Woesearchaeota archaeon]